MKKLILVLAMIFLGSTAWAQTAPAPVPAPVVAPAVVTSAFKFSASDSYSVKDIQLYTRNVSGDKSEHVSTGVSYGPLYQVTHNGSWIADVVSVCGAAGVATSAPNNGWNGGIGICPFNFMGLQTAVFYDPVQNRMTWGIGLSISGLANQLLK